MIRARLLLTAALLLPVAALAQTPTPGASGANAFSGFVVNDWYLPSAAVGNATSGAASGGNLVVCTYGAINQTATISALGAFTTTTDNGKRFQLAVYTSGSWGRPGTLMVSTGNISLGAGTAALSGAASAQLASGPYWWCLNTESTTAAFRGLNPALFSAPAFVGSGTLGTVLSTSANIVGVSIAQTYGTWPSSFASNASWTEVTTALVPLVAAQIASVP